MYGIIPGTYSTQFYMIIYVTIFVISMLIILPLSFRYKYNNVLKSLDVVIDKFKNKQFASTQERDKEKEQLRAFLLQAKDKVPFRVQIKIDERINLL